jgi:hypothetical protein
MTMRGLQLILSVAALALGFCLLAAPAEANHGCRYDPYGYRAPSRDCFRHYRDDWRDEPPPYVVAYPPYPVYQHYRYPSYPRDGFITVPVYSGIYGPPPECYYDHGWYRVVLVCY